MRVLDANFLIDYLNGDPDAEAYYESNGGAKELWMMPAPAYAETLVGVGNRPTGDVDRAIEALSWGEVYDIDEDLSYGLL
jgi:predicted nucleic acid-binding protein